jgi:hypothetical protein
MLERLARALGLAAAGWTLLGVASTAQIDGPFKIAFYNIRSGEGIPGLRGHASAFSDVSNCTDSSKPMNAWGVGIVQKTLTSAAGSDPAVIALGLAEAWTNVCASPNMSAQCSGGSRLRRCGMVAASDHYGIIATYADAHTHR